MDEAEEGMRSGEARLSSATDASCHSPNLYVSPMHNTFPQASMVNGYEMYTARKQKLVLWLYQPISRSIGDSDVITDTPIASVVEGLGCESSPSRRVE